MYNHATNWPYYFPQWEKIWVIPNKYFIRRLFKDICAKTSLCRNSYFCFYITRPFSEIHHHNAWSRRKKKEKEERRCCRPARYTCRLLHVVSCMFMILLAFPHFIVAFWTPMNSEHVIFACSNASLFISVSFWSTADYCRKSCYHTSSSQKGQDAVENFFANKWDVN